MFAVDGGVVFSLSFVWGVSSDVKSVEDFDFENSADRPVDDLVFFGFLPSFFSGDEDLRLFTFSLPTKDLSDTALFVLLCSPKLLLSSSYTSIGFGGERTLSGSRPDSFNCCPLCGWSGGRM